MALNKILSGMVQDFCEKNNYSDLAISKAYEYFVNYSIISKFHPEAFADPEDIREVDVDNGNSMFGIDCVAVIVNDNLIFNKNDIEMYSKANTLDVKLVFIQTKIEERYDSGDLLKTISAVKSFFSDRVLLSAGDQMQNAFEIYNELCEYKNSRLFNSASPRCYIYYVTAAGPCEMSQILKLCEKERTNFLSSFSDIKNVEIQPVGSEYITNAYKEIENRIEVHINFRNSLSLDKIEQVEQSYLGYLTGSEFLKIICDPQGNLRRRLFYENVRDYQGTTPVNGEIRSTISTLNLHDKFILLNNGITIVARHFKPLGSNEYEMTDFQIVNGCQTSNELFLQKEKISDILIPVKIIHTTDSELIALIVRASNRQTTVPDEAFVAMEAYHKKLQDLFDSYSKDMPQKLYYERRSGEFDFLEKRPQRYQVVTLHGLIRCVTAVYFQDAYVVYNNNPVSILTSRKNQLFKEKHIPEVYYVSNYLLAQFSYFNHKKLFGADETRNRNIRYYVPMVARILLSRNTKIPDLSSKQAAIEAKAIISILQNKPEEVKSTFIQAANIINDSISEFKSSETTIKEKDIIRSQKFNQLVIKKTEEAIMA